MFWSRPQTFGVLVAASWLLSGQRGMADEPLVQELRSQRVGPITYFHLRVRPPADLLVFREEPNAPAEVQRRALARLPLLVSQDGAASAVYPRLLLRSYWPSVSLTSSERKQVPIEGLEFVGKVNGAKADMLLIYPREGSGAPPRGLPAADAPLPDPKQGWSEIKIPLDLSTATPLPALKRAPERTAETAPQRDDLEGLWAEAQAARFALLHAQTPELGFYNIAAQVTGRKYGIRAPILEGSKRTAPQLVHQQLYETMSGGSAVVQSLAWQRMLSADAESRDRRTIAIDQVAGVRVPEHSWERMLAGQQAAEIDPTAGLVPHDHYFISFQNVPSLLSFAELLELWGGNLLRALQIHDRDHELRSRYEKQLCLRSHELGKTLQPGWLRELAITGTDPYLVEGSDLSVILHVTKREQVLAALAPLIEQARKEHGDALREAKSDYGGVTIESFTTPLREVSLHRAVVGDFILCSNSPVALRRILDVHAGKRKALVDALDYRYMRTVFRRQEVPENGFMFLPDAFIRQLVSPASKIKLKRRLEARMGLALVTHGALYVAWESGKLPPDHAAFLTDSTMRPREIEMPEGQGAVWDGKARIATSAVYNTLPFSTPLVELSIDRVTPKEVEGYDRFRQEYSRLWQRFFDPIGVRYTQKGSKTQLDVHILPLVRSEQYEWVRQLAGTGTTSLDLAAIPPGTVFQFLSHRHDASDFEKKIFGNWVMLRADDSPLYQELADVWVRKSLQHPDDEPGRQAARVAVRLPLVGGVALKNPHQLSCLLHFLFQIWSEEFKLRKEDSTRYKDVTIERIRFHDESPFVRWLNERVGNKEDLLKATLHFMEIDKVGYVSFSEAALHKVIDQSKQPKPSRSDVVQVGTSVYLAPGKAQRMRPLVHGVMEWETHVRALANGPCWYALYRSNLVNDDMPEEKQRAAALRHLGFIPASPDGVAYRYARRSDDVVNQRHGSLRSPQLHRAPHANLTLAQLFDQLQTLRSDLRFTEDGVRTTVIFDRKSAAQAAAEKKEPLASLLKVGAEIGLDETLPGAPVVAMDLSKVPCDEAIFESLKWFRDLRELNLTSTATRDSHLKVMKAYSRLHTLNLDNTGVTDAGLEHLHSLGNLRVLRIDARSISDDGVRLLKQKLPELTVLRRTDRERAIAFVGQLRGKVTGDRVDLSNTATGDDDIASLRRLGPIAGLNLRRTAVSDAGIETICRQFPDVAELDLSETKATDAVLARLARLPRLRSLTLDGTVVSDAGLPQLKGMTPLRTLAIETPTVSDAGAQALRQQLPMLKITRLTDRERATDFFRRRGTVEFEDAEVGDSVIGLDLTGGVGDADLSGLKHFPRLKRLVLDKAPITDEGLANLVPCASLEELVLTRTPVTNSGMPHVLKLSRLHTLALANTRLTTAGIKDLSQLEDLRKLTIDGRFVQTHDGIKYLKTLKHLRTLRIEHFSPGHPTIKVLGKALPDVVIEAYYNREEALAVIRQLGARTRMHDKRPGLIVEIDLSYRDVTDEQAAYLSAFPEVETLDLTGTKVGSTGVSHLGHLPRLRHLYLTFTKVDDAGLASIGTLKELRWLILRDTAITDAGLDQLKGLSKLEMLNVRFTGVTAEGVRRLRTALPEASIQFRRND